MSFKERAVQYQYSAIDLVLPSTVPPAALATAVTFGSFGSLIVSALTTPPVLLIMFIVPPLPTDTPLAVAPITFIVPPLPTEVWSAVPAPTFIVPPLPTDVPLAVPPTMPPT